MSTSPTDSGLAPINGLQLYWESSGSGGTPLILLHGGYGGTDMFGPLIDQLAANRRVIAVDLQGHARTADIDRPLSYHAFGDDISALISHLELGQVDLMGYSLGGGAALRTAIQHPDQVRKLVLVSTVFAQHGWYPEMVAQMKQMDRRLFPMMQQTPLYPAYRAVAPDPEGFPALMDKMGALLAAPYDWSAEVRAMTTPTLLIAADADGFPPAHVVEFFALLGGGQRDAGWDNAGRPPGQLAILPDESHYSIIAAPSLGLLPVAFLDAPPQSTASAR